MDGMLTSNEAHCGLKVRRTYFAYTNYDRLTHVLAELVTVKYDFNKGNFIVRRAFPFYRAAWNTDAV